MCWYIISWFKLCCLSGGAKAGTSNVSISDGGGGCLRSAQGWEMRGREWEKPIYLTQIKV